jgi:hypothetical protein
VVVEVLHDVRYAQQALRPGHCSCFTNLTPPLCAGSTALYVFLYSIVYFSRLESNMFVTYLLYFGYMGVISLGVFLVTGELLSSRLLVHLSPV